MSALHNNTDGRSAWMIIDKFFTFLSDEIHGRAPSTESYVWGEETCRLPLDAYLVWSIHQDGVPEPLPEPVGPAPPPKDSVSLYGTLQKTINK